MNAKKSCDSTRNAVERSGDKANTFAFAFARRVGTPFCLCALFVGCRIPGPRFPFSVCDHHFLGALLSVFLPGLILRSSTSVQFAFIEVPVPTLPKERKNQARKKTPGWWWCRYTYFFFVGSTTHRPSQATGKTLFVPFFRIAACFFFRYFDCHGRPRWRSSGKALALLALHGAL